jgi:hypothetical protein
MSDSNELKSVNTLKISGKSHTSPLKSKKVFAVILLMVIVVGVGGWFIYDRVFKEDSLPAVQTRSVELDATVKAKIIANHFLQGDASGAGMKFSLPWAEFIYTDSPASLAEPRFPEKQEDVSKEIIKDGNNTELGIRLTAGSSGSLFQALAVGKIVPSSEVDNFDKKDYFGTLIAKLMFNNTGGPSSIGLLMGEPVQFTNTSITSGASLYGLSASSTATKRAPVSHITGELVEVKGLNATYYLLITSIDENWSSNPQTWQFAKDSIKVDQ